ncbi:MAG TPA: 3'-5' exonuclease, partial [Ignavibacteriaceae bacterium]|nr:3'-5' exonuclease [Ignavibacteriaceae bacterium]
MKQDNKISADVFLLTGEWSDYSGNNILKFIGTNDELGAVEIIVTNNKPVFFIERSAILNPLNKSYLRKETKLKNFNNQPVDAIYFNTQKQLISTLDELNQNNLTTYESDVDPLRRFLMEKSINSQMKITGVAEQKSLITKFLNPIVEPCNVTPNFTIASIDIETGAKTNQLYSIAIHVTGKKGEHKKVFMIGEKPKRSPEFISFFADERDLLTNFFIWFKEIDPDIIIGWHVIGFDLLFLDNKCRELGINLDIARSNGRVSIRQRKPSGHFISITGRVVIDGPSMLRASFFNFEDFKLETVAQELLGTGKTITPDENKVEEIDRLFKDDKTALAEYNLQDAILVTDIFKKTGLIELSVRRAQISGLLMDQLGMMTAAFDHFYLP